LALAVNTKVAPMNQECLRLNMGSPLRGALNLRRGCSAANGHDWFYPRELDAGVVNNKNDSFHTI
jgi:hypothetical protein